MHNLIIQDNPKITCSTTSSTTAAVNSANRGSSSKEFPLYASGRDHVPGPLNDEHFTSPPHIKISTLEAPVLEDIPKYTLNLNNSPKPLPMPKLCLRYTSAHRRTLKAKALSYLQFKTSLVSQLAFEESALFPQAP
jgi:hypothetical protein